MPDVTRTSPHIAFYSATYLLRSENFLYHQLRGMSRATTSVVAVRGANLVEFPVDSLFLAQARQRSIAWTIDGVRRRLTRDRGSLYTLPTIFARRIRDQLEVSRPDLVYCLFGWNACQLLDVFEGLSFRVPLVFHGAGTDITAAASFGSAYAAKLRRAFERATVILCGSRFLKQKLLELGAPEKKIQVHYIGVDVPAHSSQADGSSVRAPFTILAVSRLVPVKGLNHTIGAFAAVASRLPGAILEIIGDGPCRVEYESLAQQLGVFDRVLFRGELRQAEVFDAMRRAHVFVQHNIRSPDGQEEGLGGTIIEAAACALPVVVTRSGGIPEAVRDGETGFVTAPGDEEAMARALVELYRRPDLRAQFGAAGRLLVASEFNRARQNERLEQLLLQCCS